ncbi:cbb3-type cytochrome oxidase subunit 3 [Methylophilus medardicus]|uniref:Cbb3-type cytochrome c oxidase subunit 3 n=1 Tax=Methylophilus medardicus TaxID=2588534 RepID=A0A5B8CRL6_9PROT|nr:cbb3-type cytochrome c oxidase subunit 3 [Methylophilus medardicus]QDC43928.1 cbb3-type cytochrome c oxidase subunit 3 [Methylophilus medardicus]QDC48935.1 cbb3-type cytochrome c oxidase subunit 3 [Methylophilus medardicus]QDC52640.1 cbb3-type cytochrome c oxidase subunit 3 [Methylophilus medardicus]
MDINLLRILFTVLSFVLFMAIMVWAWRNRNSAQFKDAQNLPFDQDE